MTEAPIRAGIYNRFWRSRGGGERHSGMVAELLARKGLHVDLIGHEDVDLDALGNHLGLDLSGCRVRVLSDSGDRQVSEVSAEYDLFVNASYMSRLPSRAKHSAYLCYFPTPQSHDLASWRRVASRTLGRYVRSAEPTNLSYGLGWFPPEGSRRRSWTWTSGDAALTLPPGAAVGLIFEAGRPGGPGTVLVIDVDGTAVFRAVVGPEFGKHEIALPESTAPRVVRFRSDTFVPGPSDSRELGIALSRMRPSSASRDPRRLVAERFPWLMVEQLDQTYLDSYDVILANSRFTRGWIRKFWGREAEVLYPPIQVERFHPVAQRSPSIVIAGRFFAPKLGHSKRQLEQVRAFARMVDAGLLRGWTLHVIGGCEPSQRAYVDKVRAAGWGYRVELHVNAARHELEDIMSNASIVWSATGFGEDESDAPWASEHFGMTTVEAMAAGCVPVVIDRAGQREIVRHGQDGFRWSTLRELTERTIQVVVDEPLRAGMSASSVTRAQQYSDAAFAHRLDELIDRYSLF
jgi:glycosyltransferase involved in cell wall biosynthesis